MRIYDLEKVRALLKHGGDPRSALLWSTIITASEGTHIDGDVISNLKWTPDSSGLAFLTEAVGDKTHKMQLKLADLREKRVVELTPASQDVRAFAITRRDDFVYIVGRPARTSDASSRARSVATSWLPDALGTFSHSAAIADQDHGVLWRSVGGRRRPIVDAATGAPIVTSAESASCLALSLDGKTVVVALPLAVVPSEWPSRFPHGDVNRTIQAGPQDLATMFLPANSYFAVDLASGRKKELVSSPDPADLGWLVNSSVIKWSRDGRSVLLPAFADERRPTNPCLAIVTVDTSRLQCLEPVSRRSVNGRFNSNFSFLLDAAFVGPGSDEVHARYSGYGFYVTREFTQSANGWSVLERKYAADLSQNGDVRFTIKEAWNVLPVLAATDTASGRSLVLWDPNPQLTAVDLGATKEFAWRDASGTTWHGGLFLPADYTPGKRYPLVVQTHGFLANQFALGGFYATAFAARELAASGILVLQVNDAICDGALGTVREAPCAVGGYDSAVANLVAQGLADPGRIGIIGFSITYYYVDYALAFGRTHYAAASLTDGVNASYYQYLTNANTPDFYKLGYEGENGASPFGAGLQSWLKNSPEFNFDKMATPVIVNFLGATCAIFDWGTVATLRILGKPVEAMLLDSDEHVLTDPEIRLTSQGGSVEWFRFWLQGYEDPDSAKHEQYARWEGLCDLQRAENPTRPPFCVPSKSH